MKQKFTSGSAKEETKTLDSGVTVPALILRKFDNDKFPFTIGIGRARLIVQHYPAILEFYKKYDNSKK